MTISTFESTLKMKFGICEVTNSTVRNFQGYEISKDNFSKLYSLVVKYSNLQNVMFYYKEM